IEQNNVLQKDLIDNILRSQSSYATADDIKKLARDNKINLDAIKKDLNNIGAHVESINVVKVQSIGVSKKDIKSTNTGEVNENPPKEVECVDGVCENPDIHGYLGKEQVLKLEEPFSNGSVPLGEVGFSAWKDAPWRLELSKRIYSSTTVVGEDDEHRQYVYNKFSVEVDGKKYDIKLDSSEMKQVYPTASWHWFNPRLSLGIAAGLNFTKVKQQIVPNLGLSIMSYGKYVTNPEFSVLTLGFGYDLVSDTMDLTVAPVSYNIGNNLPVINNTYLGPIVGFNSDGDMSLLFGISAGL